MFSLLLLFALSASSPAKDGFAPDRKEFDLYELKVGVAPRP